MAGTGAIPQDQAWPGLGLAGPSLQRLQEPRMDFPPETVLLLSRVQFAFTVSFHIIFPAFTIGLSAFIATLLIQYLRTGREHYRSLARFWTKVFAVSFAMGVVSGIVLSYQFGTNWSRFSEVTGNVIGPVIGYEVLTAFFLEATFLGIMLFGSHRVPPWLHALSAVIVAVGTRCRPSGSCPRTAGCTRRRATRCATASPFP
jgi:cytochrome bd ubiquinol oxidase subunit I